MHLDAPEADAHAIGHRAPCRPSRKITVARSAPASRGSRHRRRAPRCGRHTRGPGQHVPRDHFGPRSPNSNVGHRRAAPVPTVAGRPARHVDRERSPRRVDRDVDARRRSRACRSCRRRRGRERGRQSAMRTTRLRHQLDAAVEAGHPPLVLVLDPARVAPLRHGDGDLVRRVRRWSVISNVDASRLSLPSPMNRPFTHTHAIASAEPIRTNVRRPPSTPADGNVRRYTAGRVVGRHVGCVERERHPDVEVRRSAVALQRPAARHLHRTPAVRRADDVAVADGVGMRRQAETPCPIERHDPWRRGHRRFTGGGDLDPADRLHLGRQPAAERERIHGRSLCQKAGSESWASRSGRNVGPDGWTGRVTYSSSPMPSSAHLTDGRVSIVIATVGGCAEILYWGAALGPVDLDAMSRARSAARSPVAPSTRRHRRRSFPSTVPGTPVVPGWPAIDPTGRVGLPGSRPCRRRSTRAMWRSSAVTTSPGSNSRAASSSHPSGLLRARATVTNVGDSPYTLGHLELTVPLPAHAVDVITFHGRWSRELHPHRRTLRDGAVAVENRTGRTSHEHPPLVWIGEHGFGEQHGDVWGLHLAWSGNAHLRVERLADGRPSPPPANCSGRARSSSTRARRTRRRRCSAPTRRRDSPTPAGRTTASPAPCGPPARAPRPVLVNTWEAVYFDQDPDRLRRLAERAARVGAERFVLDDGWFSGRRDDTSSLGDWWVSADVHPADSHPLIDHVRRLGMEFGLWVEPEMVSPDSDLPRPPRLDLPAPGYEPVLGRHQLVLDLTRHDAFDTVRSARPVVARSRHRLPQVGHEPRARRRRATPPGVRPPTPRRSPWYPSSTGCAASPPTWRSRAAASGGGRIDLGILQRTEHVWTSDCNDALERQTIQRWASTPDPAGGDGCAHQSPRSHTTGRTHSLSFPRRHGLLRSPRPGVEPARPRRRRDSPASPRSWRSHRRHRPTAPQR